MPQEKNTGQPRLIVNADDLGMSVHVNDAVFGLLADGRISSATLLVNAPCFDDAVQRAREFPHHSFGVHLCLTEGAPLAPCEDLRPLLSADGRFAGLDRLREVRMTRKLQDAVVREWSCQIERAWAKKLPISHIDSHHHVHMQRKFLFALKAVQSKYCLDTMRGATRCWRHDGRKPRFRVRFTQALYTFLLRHYKRRAVTPDLWMSAEEFVLEMKRGQAQKHLWYEVLCHPGSEHFSGDEPYLRGAEWSEVLANVRLGTFKDLWQKEATRNSKGQTIFGQD
jgi:predicted glycoside hydrolase/deacetylase ChbG (UPF0249 family)